MGEGGAGEAGAAEASEAGSAEAERVTAFWERLGLPGLVDVHTHFMPERVLRKVWAYFDSVGPLTGVKWPITYRHDEERRLAVLRGFGVRAFTSMLYPHKAGMAEWLNGWAAQFAARTPDCLHTATLFPEPEAGRYVRAAVEGGARVFKSHVQVGAYDPNDALLDPADVPEVRTAVARYARDLPADGCIRVGTRAITWLARRIGAGTPLTIKR